MLLHPRARALVCAALLLVAILAAAPGTGTTSAPAANAARRERPTSFLVVGDWGRYGNHRQRDVAQRMAHTADSLAARFVISTGDNFYNDGVTSLTDRHWQDSFERVYDAASLQVPWYVIFGNHDYRGSTTAQLQYAKRSKRWRIPSRWYSIRERLRGGGTLEVFFIDTNHAFEHYRKDKRFKELRAEAWTEQLAWLDRELGRSRADWRVVVGHHPVRSYGSHGAAAEIAKPLQPILERHRVALYMNGHEHDLQHIVTNGVHYVTSGAGSLTRRTRSGADTQYALGEVPGFAAVTVTRDTLALSFVDVDGVLRHTFRMGRIAPTSAR
jgi:tartrate-resistant acid phosphatase type 5